MTSTKQAIEPQGVTEGAAGGKARIERAAVTLFCARGVDAVTTREIAGAAKISEGALYRHYPSKEALAQAMFFAVHSRLARQISLAARNAGAVQDKARAIVSAYVSVADRDWPLFAYHLLTTHRFLPYSSQLAQSPEIENPVAIVESVVSEAMKNGEIPSGLANLKAASALGVVLQAALHKYYGRIQGDLSLHEEALANAVVAVLKS